MIYAVKQQAGKFIYDAFTNEQNTFESLQNVYDDDADATIVKNYHRQIVEVRTDKTVLDQICDTDKAGKTHLKKWYR